MRVLVAGLSTQTSAAVEWIIGSVFRGATVVQHPRGPGCTTDALATDAGHCDFCVIDLVGLGWSVRTPEREFALQDTVLGDLPAIVLLPSGDSGWTESAVLKGRPQPRIGLLQPASMTSLQEALLLLRHRGPTAWAARSADPGRASARQPAAPAATIRGAVVMSDRAPASAEQLVLADAPTAKPSAPGRRPTSARMAPSTAPSPVAPAGVAPTVEPATAPNRPPTAERPAPAADRAAPLVPAKFRLDAAERSALVRACPPLREEAFLNLVLDLLERGTSCEIRIGSRAGIVLCPERNWAASNLSVALRRRIAQHRLMLDIIETRSMSPAEAARTARGLYGRRRDGRRALDTFVFSFVLALLGEDPPEVDGSLGFRLRRFPDFTRLQPAGDLYLQLALHTLHQAQTAAELRSTFARHDPRQISLFIICALLSGVASTPSLAAQPGPTTRGKAAAKPAAARLGFIRSLLAKLF